MKKYIWILAALLLLALCAAQPPEPMPEVVKPTGFSLNASDMSFFNPGELYDLRVKLVPADAEMPDVTWTSSDPNVASVSWNGRVIAISKGTVTVTASIEGLGEQSCIFRCRFTGSAPPAVESTPEPTPEPTSVGIEIDIGDGEHTFWVELTKREEDIGGIWVNIYRNEGDAEPFQQFEDHARNLARAKIIAEDVDFDGRIDFHFEQDWGSLPVFWHSYYVWNTDEEKFVPDPYGLHSIPNAEFWPYSQQVVSAMRVEKYYQYKDGELTLVGETFIPEEGEELKAYMSRYVTVDDAHTFWVEVVDTEPWGSFEINIYCEKGDTQPFQTLEGSRETYFQDLYWNIEDMDFDGDTDFGVLCGEAPNGHAGFSYYIWDEKSSKFVPDPYGLNELCSVGAPDMLPEEKAIRTFMRSRAGMVGEVRFYRYLKEGFTCVRTMSWSWHDDMERASFLVQNYENGEMRTAYEETCPKESLGDYLWSEEFSNWWDLSYHGE